MSNIIQGLWIGDSLSTMEQLSISSFLKNNHEYHLYTYNDIKNIPEETIIKDGNEISDILEYTYKKVDNSKLTYENICASIVSRFKSRTTIKNILNEGVNKGFFIKKKSNIDPRNKNYTPSIPVESFMKRWIKKGKKNI